MNLFKSIISAGFLANAIYILILAQSPVYAQEATLLGGKINSSESCDLSNTWQFSYREKIAGPFEWSFSWLNEGHFPGHHRDGQTFQFWIFSKIPDYRLRLSAGVGPYLYFDTATDDHKAYEDNHGWGTVFSLSATWYARSRWQIQLLANQVLTGTDFNTTAILMGVGYRFDLPLSAQETPVGGVSDWWPKKNEVTLFIGNTILNSFESEDSLATEIEYRRRIIPNLDWTLGCLYEGNVRLSRRTGITTQVWPTRRFWNNRLSLGLGLGIYVAVDSRSGQESGRSSDDIVAGILTMTASYDIIPQFPMRLSWNRTVTNYDRDTDIILVGLGYRF